jgi:hypothetical protein
VSGGDVVSTLARASEHAREAEPYRVFCVVPAADGIELVRLTGNHSTRAHLPLGPPDGVRSDGRERELSPWVRVLPRQLHTRPGGSF